MSLQIAKQLYAKMPDVIAKARKKAKKAKKLKITIKTTGKTKAQLEASGNARVKAKISFKPTSGISVKKIKSITLKQG